MDYTIRKASLDDREAIERLIAESARGLSQGDYSGEQIEAAIATVFGVDTDLIVDGTYFVAEGSENLVGCGGWSKRRTLFGGDQYGKRDSNELDAQTEPARIRAFFVHPDWARRGFGSRLLDAGEQAARAAGFTRLELGATLTGIPLYERHGFRQMERSDVPLPNGATIPIVRMSKVLD